MYQASNCYVTNVEAEEWERPTHKEEQIITFKAQVKQLKANAASYVSSASQPGTPCTPKTLGGNTLNIKPP